MPAHVLENGYSYPSIELPRVKDEIVISGISGRLPESDNILEFRDNLMKKYDMVNDLETRWPKNLYGLPERTGKIKDLSKFDANFFSVNPKQAHVMDPQLRLLLEASYEAIMDAGINPQKICGSRTGVFIGNSASEAHEAWSLEADKTIGYTMTGCTRSMFANRLSFALDLKGPSFCVDTACSSSLLAFENALNAIRTGQCDAAIVGGTNICVKPTISLQFQKLSMLSPHGTCKSFSADGNGYCRSEAVVCVFLQKAQHAKRIYCYAVHAKTNSDGFKHEGITFPSGKMQKALIEQTYAEAGLNPLAVSYVEAHGTGTQAGDPQECNSLADFFCDARLQRPLPLLIGSVKSNMGHPEPASGLSALAKIIIAMEENLIPPNLHFSTPNPNIPALVNGQLKVVTEMTPWNGEYMALNNFGFGGSNVHAIFRAFTPNAYRELSENGYSPSQMNGFSAHPINEDNEINGNEIIAEINPKFGKFQTHMPRLLLTSGRTEEGVSHMFEFGMAHANNEYLQAMLSDIMCDMNVSNYPFRGYSLLVSPDPSSPTDNIMSEIKKQVPTRRPLWYVFSGMGTQWTGMGRALLCVPAFARAMEVCASALAPHGLDLYAMLQSDDPDTLAASTLNSFVSVAAIQIGLVDCLKELGLRPDGIVGHSVGELGCGYADGGFTAKQMILAAYWRGRCIQEAKLPPGAMAAVGLTWEEAKIKCPPGIVPACHNAEDTVTISGPKADIEKFVETLKAEGYFAREVNSAGVAFHSYFMHPIGPILKAALDKVITPGTAKPRSKRWISSSIPEADWNSPLAQECSAAYHANNLCSPVLFQEALKHIPSNAVTVEIAPHCLLHSILKRSLGPEASFVSLMKRGHENNLHYFLENVGKLYTLGYDVHTGCLYPRVSYPVPRGTPMIAPHMRWDHSDVWDVPTWHHFDAVLQGDLERTGALNNASGLVYPIDMTLVAAAADKKTDEEVMTDDTKENLSYLFGHNIDGRTLYPATGYLVLAWMALAKRLKKPYTEVPIIVEDFRILRATILTHSTQTRFEVNLLPNFNQFEIVENQALVATGSIQAVSTKSSHTNNSDPNIPPNNPLEIPEVDPVDLQSSLSVMETKDIYKELSLRGYEYYDQFRGIMKWEKNKSQLVWTGNWVTFLDTMLQSQIMSTTSRTLYIPSRIKHIKIDPLLHSNRCIHLGTGKDTREKGNMDENADTVTSETKKGKDGTATEGFLDYFNCTYERDLSKTIAGGVEIFGLHTTSISRKPAHANPPVLEKYVFVPFDCNPTTDVQQTTNLSQDMSQLTSYQTLCEKIISKNAKKLTTMSNLFPNPEWIKMIANSPDLASFNQELDVEKDMKMIESKIAKPNLLKYLTELFALPMEPSLFPNIMKLYAETMNEIYTDDLLNTMTRRNIDESSPVSLRSMIDLLVQNVTPFRRIRALQLDTMSNKCNIPLLIQAYQAMNLQPQTKLAFDLAINNDTTIKQTDLNNNTIADISSFLPTTNDGQQNLQKIEAMLETMGLTGPAHEKTLKMLNDFNFVETINSTNTLTEYDSNTKLFSQFVTMAETAAYDFIIADRILSLCVDPVFALKAIANELLRSNDNDLLAPKFVLVREYTSHFTLPGMVDGMLVSQLYGLPPQKLIINASGSSKQEISVQRHAGLYFTAQDWDTIFTSAGFTPVLCQTDGLNSTLWLLKFHHDSQAILSHELINLDTYTMNVMNGKDKGLDMNMEQCVNSFEWINVLKEKMYASDNKMRRIWLYTSQDDTPGLVGFLNCLKQEPNGDLVRVIMDKKARAPDGHGILCSNDVYCLVKENPDSDFMRILAPRDLYINVWDECSKTWGSYRHLPLDLTTLNITPQGEKTAAQSKTMHHYFVNSLKRGDLSSLSWVSAGSLAGDKKNDDFMIVDVAYAALNFRDIMLATGKLPPDAIPGNHSPTDCLLGMEFSGHCNDKSIKTPLMGLVPARGLATQVRVNREFTWPIPQGWTLAQAATIPVVYATAYYALIIRGQLKQGESVLIHSGSGGVGQAAISIALNMGCQVFTSVGSLAKREFLKRRFGGTQHENFTDDCICNSRDLSFEDHIKRKTGGRGVDVVLNSLSEEKLQASVRLLAQHGRFLEIGKYDLSNNNALGMAVFLKNVSFHGILLDALFEPGNKDWRAVKDLVSAGLASGVVQPLEYTSFPALKVEEAFRYMAQGKHIGKVLLEINDDVDSIFHNVSPGIAENAVVRATFNPHAWYIITGGLGGFGLELADWLVAKNVRYLVLTSRSGIKTPYQASRISDWRNRGVRVVISTADACNATDCRKMLLNPAHLASQVQNMANNNKNNNESNLPIDGIFHLAAVLKDGFFENLTPETFAQVYWSKAQSARTLDALTREMWPAMSYFVTFSSISCGRGNMGQTNYGLANSVMERICENRKRQGFSGQAIQWGAIGDVGLIMDTMSGNDTVVGGTLPQRMSSCLETLDSVLSLGCCCRPLSKNQEQNSMDSYCVVSSYILADKYEAFGGSAETSTKSKVNVIDAIAHILGIKDISSVNQETSLGDLGLDSLMGVEIKQTLEREYELVLSTKEIRALTFKKIKGMMASAGGKGSSGDHLSINIHPNLSSPPPPDHLSPTIGIDLILRRYNINDLVPKETVLYFKGADHENCSSPIFLFHPIEGSLVSLGTLIKLLDKPIIGFQCTQDVCQDSVPKMAEYYLNLMLKLKKPPYTIVAYSFGATIAFQVALQLQARNIPIKNLIFLDGSHSFVAIHTQWHLTKLTPGSDLEKYAEIMVAFVLLFVGSDYKRLKEKFASIKSIEEIKKVAIDRIMATNLFPNREDLSLASDYYYQKLVICDSYRPSDVYCGDITLIRLKEAEERLGQDYGLSSVCKGQIDIHYVEGDHETFIIGDNAYQTVAYINQSLK